MADRSGNIILLMWWIQPAMGSQVLSPPQHKTKNSQMKLPLWISYTKNPPLEGARGNIM